MKQDRREFIKNSSVFTMGLAGLSANQIFSPFDDTPQLNNESGLKITKIESFLNGATTLVKVTADDGSYGYGQAAPYHNNITQIVLHQMVARHALGKDPYQPESIAENCIEQNYKFPWSFVCRATAGLETALWDLQGRREGKSVVALIGGKPGRVPVYGSSMQREITPADEAARLVKLRDEKGFTAFKIRVGKTIGHDQDQWPGRTEEIIPTVRDSVGAGVRLLADGNSCYSPAKAIEVGKMMQDNDYYFFEEPCPYWELEWTAEVNNALEMKVAGGEQDNDMAQWRRMIKMNAVDIVQPDICYIGGISRTLKVAQMAAKAGKTCVPHSANISLLTVFAMHLMAAIPNAAPFLEYSIEHSEWTQDSFYSPVPSVEAGHIKISEEPGWGIMIKPGWLKNAAYQVTD